MTDIDAKMLESLSRYTKFVDELYLKASARSLVYSYEIKDLMEKYGVLEKEALY